MARTGEREVAGPDVLARVRWARFTLRERIHVRTMAPEVEVWLPVGSTFEVRAGLAADGRLEAEDPPCATSALEPSILLLDQEGASIAEHVRGTAEAGNTSSGVGR